ncbi:MAG: helical backbone metal receptor [Caldilineaceae bacterium]
MRIVSLEPSVTATLLALGQAEKLVAVSRYCVCPAELNHLPRLPSTWSVQASDVVSLQPDLVIASVPYRTESITELLQAQLDVLCLYPNRLDDVYRHIQLLGNLTGVGEQAVQMVAEMQPELDRLHQQAMRRPRRRVYVEMWPKPPMNSVAWVAELIELLNGEFVPMPAGRIVTVEELQDADPDLIVIAWAGIPQPELNLVYERPGWQALRAIRTGQVIAVDELLLNAPGTNLAQGAQQLAAALEGAEDRGQRTEGRGQRTESRTSDATVRATSER